jgi:hypothetical protein
MGRLVKKGGNRYLSGAAGNAEFYSMGGETFFKVRSRRHRKSKSKAAVSGRNNFKSVVTLAREINKLPVFNEIWKHSSLRGRNTYQKLIKYNMPLAYDGNLTIKNYFTPKGPDLFIPEFTLENGELDFTFDMYGLIKPPLVLHMIYYLYNYKLYNGFTFDYIYRTITISADKAAQIRKKGESKYNIKEKLIKPDIDNLAGYKDVVVLMAVTGVPSIAGRKYWTKTVGFDIPLI